MIISFNKAYKEASKTKARYRVLHGGAGSGKSHFVAEEIILNMLEDRNYNYLVVRKTGKSIKNSVFRLLQDLISQYNLNDKFIVNKADMSLFCVNGAKLITSGLDDVEKLKSIANINRIWVEESTEISETDFNQLDLRMRGQSKLGYQMTITFNPVSELHWIKKSFFDIGRKDSYILKTTYKDNRFLDDKYIDTLKELEKQDYQYYRIYCLGEWGSIGNLIYTNWEKQDLSSIKDKFDNIVNGLDFGFADDPTAYIRTHYDKKHKTIYVFDELYECGMFIDELSERLKKILNNEFVTCDSSEPRSIADLKRHGIKALGAKKGAGSIEHGIKWLQMHKIIVDYNCTNTIKELTSYKWREDKEGNIIPKPIDLNNHILDALRYAYEDEMKNSKLKTMSKSILGI